MYSYDARRLTFDLFMTRSNLHTHTFLCVKMLKQRGYLPLPLGYVCIKNRTIFKRLLEPLDHFFTRFHVRPSENRKGIDNMFKWFCAI